MIGISIKKVYTLIGATSHSADKRQNDDYYATEPKAVESLLKVEDFNNYILEPCCGSGHISKVLKKHGFDVTSEELFDRGYGNIGVDYFERTSWNGDIITNPPYKNCLDFIKHSLNIIPDGRKVAMLLRIQFLKSKNRRKFFDESPPVRIHVFSERILCSKNGEFKTNESKAVCYAWFIWEKGFKGEPKLDWI